MYSDVIVLKSVWGKLGQKYFINPAPDPKTGRLPDCVRTVNSNGDMILSESDKEEISNGTSHFFPANHIFVIEDGYRLDTSDLVDKAIWECIKNCSIIAVEKGQKDANGYNVINGDAQRYGKAELYVERPGEMAKIRVTKKTLRYKAESYIHEDSESNRIRKCKVLGRNLDNAIPADVLDYMINIAESDPQKIIDLYEGENWKMHLFILEAVDRGVIRKSEGMFKYDDKILGATIESTIAMLRDIKYKKILNSIKVETYPEYLTKEEIDTIQAESDQILKSAAEDKSKTTKK